MATASRAYTVHDGKQAGYAVFGGARRACNWNGSAASFVDIHPDWLGATSSEVNAAAASGQVGHIYFGIIRVNWPQLGAMITGRLRGASFNRYHDAARWQPRDH